MDAASWRDQAVARSLDSARARAEHRVQRFLDAALELLREAPDREFTVQEVVERSGQSLRSFYQHFAGKHELLLALFEESVRATAAHLQAQIAEEDDALARLRILIIEYYAICRPVTVTSAPKPVRPSPRMLAGFAQHLLTTQPEAASRAFVPLVALVEELLDQAARDGAIRAGLRHESVAGVLLEAVMFHAFAAAIGGPSSRLPAGNPAEELCDVLLRGIGSGTAA